MSPLADLAEATAQATPPRETATQPRTPSGALVIATEIWLLTRLSKSCSHADGGCKATCRRRALREESWVAICASEDCRLCSECAGQNESANMGLSHCHCLSPLADLAEATAQATPPRETATQPRTPSGALVACTCQCCGLRVTLRYWHALHSIHSRRHDRTDTDHR